MNLLFSNSILVDIKFIIKDNPITIQNLFRKKTLKYLDLVVVKCEVVIISQIAILVILQKMKCYKIKYTAHKGVEG